MVSQLVKLIRRIAKLDKVVGDFSLFRRPLGRITPVRERLKQLGLVGADRFKERFLFLVLLHLLHLGMLLLHSAQEGTFLRHFLLFRNPCCRVAMSQFGKLRLVPDKLLIERRRQMVKLVDTLGVFPLDKLTLLRRLLG